jgi:hypothetical protein
MADATAQASRTAIVETKLIVLPSVRSQAPSSRRDCRRDDARPDKPFRS